MKAAAANFIETTTITRLLVVSFFIALSLGLIDGVDIKRLAIPFVPDPFATYLMRALMLALCAMVLFGFFRRPAALILALMVFWPSYMTLFSGGDVSAFWRDLALIGGLIMSAYEQKKTADEETAQDDQDAAVEMAIEAPA